jgi:carbamoyl-phosphate synthase large subunit
VAQDVDELKFACSYLVRQGKVALVQEYIGTPDQEYTVGVLCDLDGQLINSIAVKRYILSSLSNKIRIPNLTLKKN